MHPQHHAKQTRNSETQSASHPNQFVALDARLRIAKRKRITMGKDPAGVVAAVLYIASQIEGENVTQKEIAEAAGVTEVTLRNRKTEIVKKLGLQL